MYPIRMHIYRCTITCLGPETLEIYRVASYPKSVGLWPALYFRIFEFPSVRGRFVSTCPYVQFAGSGRTNLGWYNNVVSSASRFWLIEYYCVIRKCIYCLSSSHDALLNSTVFLLAGLNWCSFGGLDGYCLTLVEMRSIQFIGNISSKLCFWWLN